MGYIYWKNVFPSKLSSVIFVLYIVLFVNQGILVTASQKKNNEYDYNIVTVVLVTELFKLIISVVLYCKDHSPLTLLHNILENKKVLGFYLVPAFLYCIYNNLSFVNLSSFDPTTYYLFLQFRVVVTAVLFQIIFNKKLSKKQWFSLLLLTVGCMIKQFNFPEAVYGKNADRVTMKSPELVYNINIFFILVQILCSCLAGVYNEYLLKETGANVNILIQNVFMYLDSITSNVVILLLQGNLLEAFTISSVKKVFHYKVLLIMINNAAIGIVTSFFLKFLNSILKTFASALELIFTAVLCYMLFDIPIYTNTIISILIVLLAVYMYSQNPVLNVGDKIANRKNQEEKIELMMEDV